MNIALEQTPRPAVKQSTLALTPFEPALAEQVVGWVRDEDELFWLAPKTVPPLSVEKVLSWPGPGSRPMFMRTDASQELLGYLELNTMPGDGRHFWIGHCIIRPDRRGVGLGRIMMGLLLDEAFRNFRGQRVSLVVFPDNQPAIRCYQAVGFRHVGWQSRYFPVRGDYYSMWHMGIDAQSYRRAERRELLDG